MSPVDFILEMRLQKAYQLIMQQRYLSPYVNIARRVSADDPDPAVKQVARAHVSAQGPTDHSVVQVDEVHSFESWVHGAAP